MNSKIHPFKILTGRSNPQLAYNIAKILKTEVCEPVSSFANGEIRVTVPKNLRRYDVFIIQPTFPNVNDSLMELLLMIDAARRSSANEITAVVPYFAYSRQDRKDKPRVPISSSLVAKMIETAGANRIVTLDIHSEQQQGFFSQPWDNLYGSFVLIPAVKGKKLANLVVTSPDKGGMTKAVAYANRLKADGIALVYKERDVNVANKSEALEMIGNVQGKNVLLVDDMVDTAGTLVGAAEFLTKRGAKAIYACATHGLLSDPALERLENSPISQVIVTDTVFVADKAKSNRKIKVITVAPLIAEAIKRIQTGESISEGLIL